MSNRVRRSMVRGYVASALSRHLCSRMDTFAQQCEACGYPQQHDPHGRARNSHRACADFRLSVAPLRHHHHKLLRWPRSRRASSAYPQPPRRDSTDSDARTGIGTTHDTWAMQFSHLGDPSPSRYIECSTETRLMIRKQPAADSHHTLLLPLTRSIAALSLGALSLATAASLWQPRSVAAQSDPAPSSVTFYTQRVQPIFEDHCYRCHGGLNHRGHLSIATRAGLLRGGMDGAVVVPGNAAQSLLVRLIRHEGPADDPMPMPPPPHQKLSDADIAIISQWIQAGMAMPPDTPKH